jgi:hypothetical protein
MAVDIRQQLADALDEAENLASRVTAGPWRYNPDKMWNLPGQHFGKEFIGAGPLDKPICVAATGDADDPQSMADAAFIARWDPPTVLRLVERDRKVLGRHARMGNGHCDHCWRNQDSAWPCADVQDLSAFWLGEESDGPSGR